MSRLSATNDTEVQIKSDMHWMTRIRIDFIS